MKHLLLLLGITVGLAAPFAARAEQTALIADTTVPQQANTKKSRVVITAPAPRKQRRVWYEVTNLTAAGSHLPVVICHSGDLMYVVGGGAFTPSKAYRRTGSELGATGGYSVGSELTSLDPAFVASSAGAIKRP